MKGIKFDPTETVLIAGEFTDEEILSFKSHPEWLHSVRITLFKDIEELCNDGYRFFLLTDCKLFDLIVADIILQLRENYDELTLITVKPYPGYTDKTLGYCPEEYSDMTMCFSDSEKAFDAIAYLKYLTANCSKLIRYNAADFTPHFFPMAPEGSLTGSSVFTEH